MIAIVDPSREGLATNGHLDDLKLAASKMKGAERRAFQAAMAVKYCGGCARQAEAVFGWGREAVTLGLHERRTGLVCLNVHAAVCGDKLWEEKHAQQDPSFRTTLSFTRLTAAEALKQLSAQGFADELLPSPSTMAEVLNRNGYRLRPVLKAKPQKNSPRPMRSSPTSATRTKPTPTPRSGA